MEPVLVRQIIIIKNLEGETSKLAFNDNFLYHIHFLFGSYIKIVLVHSGDTYVDWSYENFCKRELSLYTFE